VLVWSGRWPQLSVTIKETNGKNVRGAKCQLFARRGLPPQDVKTILDNTWVRLKCRPIRYEIRTPGCGTFSGSQSELPQPSSTLDRMLHDPKGAALEEKCEKGVAEGTQVSRRTWIFPRGMRAWLCSQTDIRIANSLLGKTQYLSFHILPIGK